MTCHHVFGKISVFGTKKTSVKFIVMQIMLMILPELFNLRILTFFISLIISTGGYHMLLP
jgi:hypothetical protein